MADNFKGYVAFDLARAFVPALDVAIAIEHKNAVIMRAVDQQIELLVGLGQDWPRSFGLALGAAQRFNQHADDGADDENC